MRRWKHFKTTMGNHPIDEIVWVDVLVARDRFAFSPKHYIMIGYADRPGGSTTFETHLDIMESL